jgi:ABC-type antimicrobial peptide transport system ATPase subunit
MCEAVFKYCHLVTKLSEPLEETSDTINLDPRSLSLPQAKLTDRLWIEAKPLDCTVSSIEISPFVGCCDDLKKLVAKAVGVVVLNFSLTGAGRARISAMHSRRLRPISRR